jgi:hypothetical protein
MYKKHYLKILLHIYFITYTWHYYKLWNCKLFYWAAHRIWMIHWKNVPTKRYHPQHRSWWKGIKKIRQISSKLCTYRAHLAGGQRVALGSVQYTHSTELTGGKISSGPDQTFAPQGTISRSWTTSTPACVSRPLVLQITTVRTFFLPF